MSVHKIALQERKICAYVVIYVSLIFVGTWKFQTNKLRQFNYSLNIY